MPTPLEYERFRLSQDRFGQQGNQFDETMDFRRMQDERNFGYRTERDDTMMDWRRQQAAQQERLALLRMLPQQQRAQMVMGPRMSGPARAAMDYQESLDSQNAHNMAAVPSWQAERDRSNFATETGMDLRNYAAQQQMSQMARIQQRQAVVDGPMDALAQQQAADEAAMRQKAAFMGADQVGKFYGAKPGDLYNHYDPKTGMATIPGDYLQGDEPGKFVQKPGRQVKLDPGHYAALRAAFPPQQEQATDPMQLTAQRIQQIAGERRIMPQAVEAAREELKKRGRFTEQELVAALERHDAAFLQRNLTHPPNPMGQDYYWSRQQQANQVMNTEEERQQEPWYRRFGIRGMTPIATP